MWNSCLNANTPISHILISHPYIRDLSYIPSLGHIAAPTPSINQIKPIFIIPDSQSTRTALYFLLLLGYQL